MKRLSFQTTVLVFFLSILLVSLIITSCKKNNNTPCNISDSQTGPLFNKVDSLIKVTCAGCHTQGENEGGYNFDSKCNIVDNWSQINNACVLRGNMPPSGFNSTQKAIITNWVNAGHLSTN